MSAPLPQTRHLSSVTGSSCHMQITVLSMDTVLASHLYPSGKPRETQCAWFKKVLGSPIIHDNASDDCMGFTQFRLNDTIPAQMPHRQASNHWHGPAHSSEEPTTPTEPRPPLHIAPRLLRTSHRAALPTQLGPWVELFWWPHQPMLTHILAWG